MNFKELLITAIRSLKANFKRSVLTTIGIVIGISSVIAIMGIGNGVSEMVSKAISSDGSAAKGIQKINFVPKDGTPDTIGFDSSDIDMLSNSHIASNIQNIEIPDLEDGIGTGQLTINNEIKDINFKVLSQEKDFTESIKTGKKINNNELTNGSNQALIYQKVAKEYFQNPNNAVGKVLALNGQTYTIVGVIAPSENNVPDVMIPKATYLKDESRNGTTLKFKVTNGTPSTVGQNVLNLLNKKGSNKSLGAYQLSDEAQTAKQLGGMVNGITIFISAVAGISLFIAGIGVMNMMYISVSERTQEIGIRLAVGATETNIKMQFLLESIILTVSGGVVGILLGGIAAHTIAIFLPNNIRAIITIQNILFAVSISSAVGILFGWLPAKQAANKNLIDILR